VARAQTLLRYPQVRKSLEHLGGKITAADMRSLNYAADVEHKDIARIVAEFLTRKS
jgi:glycine betaine/choline ABC-type transport system substrate-binding protein